MYFPELLSKTWFRLPVDLEFQGQPGLLLDRPSRCLIVAPDLPGQNVEQIARLFQEVI